MLINFFKCLTSSSKDEFGLCDDPPPAKEPAYIDEENKENWLGIVKNADNKNAEFYAIDNCVEIYKPDSSTEIESRCDGVLCVENKIIFVELKKRGYGGWLSKAKDQLKISIDTYKEHNDINGKNIEVYACNALRPKAISGNNAVIQQFKNETGLILNAQQEIII